MAIFVIALTITVAASQIALALTSDQRKGLYRHGIWEWSLRTCPGMLRNKGYWFALKEVGKFKSVDQIIENEDGSDFYEGWQYMEGNARRFGVDRTCTYAHEQWPAILWRSEES